MSNYKRKLKPGLADLQDALFDQIDRLSDPELKGDKLDAELRRAKAVNDVAGRIVDVGRLSVNAWEAAARHGAVRGKPLALLTGPQDDAA